MKFFVSEYLTLIASLNNLGHYLHELFGQGQFRTVIFYYENTTSYAASKIIKRFGDTNMGYYGYLLINIDQDEIRPFLANDIGSEFLNVYIFDTIADGHYKQLNRKYFFDPRFHNIYLSKHLAMENEIEEFFRSIFMNSVVNAGLIFWYKVFQIYTNFPYESAFYRKVFESNDTEITMPSTIFDLLFLHNVDNLGNTSFCVLLVVDPPKVIRIPDRFRLERPYHFGGRDGIVSVIMSNALNSHWQYRTINKTFGIFHFRDSAETEAKLEKNMIPNVNLIAVDNKTIR